MTSISIDEIIDRIMSGRTMPKTRVKYPCSICYKAVRNNQGAVQWDLCDLWVHNKCNGTTDKEYELLKLRDETQSCIVCIVCMLSKNLVTVPFTLCDNTELRNINSSNSMKFLESLPNPPNFLNRLQVISILKSQIIPIANTILLKNIKRKKNLAILIYSIPMLMDLAQNMTTFMNLYQVSPHSWM